MSFIQNMVWRRGIYKIQRRRSFVLKVVQRNAYTSYFVSFSVEYHVSRNQYRIMVNIQDLVWDNVRLENNMVSCIQDVVQNIGYLENSTVSCHMQIREAYSYSSEQYGTMVYKCFVWNAVYLGKSIVPCIYMIKCKMTSIQKIVCCCCNGSVGLN